MNVTCYLKPTWTELPDWYEEVLRVPRLGQPQADLVPIISFLSRT